MRSGTPFNYEYRVLRATGEYVWHRFAIRPARPDDGRVTGWYGTGFDVDVFRRTDAALHESERSLRELLEPAPALIWCMAPSGQIGSAACRERWCQTVEVSVARG